MSPYFKKILTVFLWFVFVNFGICQTSFKADSDKGLNNYEKWKKYDGSSIYFGLLYSSLNRTKELFQEPLIAEQEYGYEVGARLLLINQSMYQPYMVFAYQNIRIKETFKFNDDVNLNAFNFHAAKVELFPINLGWRWNYFRLNVGAGGYVNLLFEANFESDTELDGKFNYGLLKNYDYGASTGIQFQIWRIMFEAKINGSLEHYFESSEGNRYAKMAHGLLGLHYVF